MDKFNPSSFYLGVVEFFAVLLPGILLSYVLLPFIEEQEISKLIALPTNEFAALGMFLLLSYILGNLLMALGSKYLDDKLYDPYRKRHLKKLGDISYKTARIIKDKLIPVSYIRDVYVKEDKEAKVTFKKKLAAYCQAHGKNPGIVFEEIYSEKFTEENFKQFKETISKIEEEKEQHGFFKRLFGKSPKPDFYGTEVLNVFKWSQAYFRFQNPEALAEIKRLEADSKFFRSLTVAFPFVFVVFVIQIIREDLYTSFWAWGLVMLSLVMIYPCFHRYADFRHKSTEKAYELIITHYHLPKVPEKEDKP